MAKNTTKKRHWIFKEYPLHLLLLPGILVTVIYRYLPMFGLVMAFQNFNPVKSFTGSDFVGLKNFKYVFNLPNFSQVFWNSVQIAVAKIIVGQVVPIVLALLLNEVYKKWFTRVTQTILFLPHFLSWVILGGVFKELLSLDGIVNTVLDSITGEKIFFMGDNKWFPIILIVTSVWNNY